MTTLLLAEHNNYKLNSATGKALSAALALGDEVHILVAGSNCRKAAEEAAKLEGVNKVLIADYVHLEHQLAEEVAVLLAHLMESYQALVSAATARGKNTLPRVAALLDVMQISDITAVKSSDTFERPIYAGSAVQTVQSIDSKKIITVRTSAFQSPAMNGATEIEEITVPNPLCISSFDSAELAKSTRPDLTSARIIVSGGRGLKSSENFKRYIEPLADLLGAAIGASRAAVDAGYVPNDLQVGQTGKVVAPELYIAVGISGAIQHLAGMRESKIIVAINKDSDAPIFQIADYGLVADLFEVLPKLEAEIARFRK
ncbi:MAG TPA: Electron transfer flavoprotein subunit alpha [Hyphomicrobiaceae bacterium MAG_BT-2024]